MPHLLVLLPPPALSDVLQTLGAFGALGPHITVKAQPGLDDDRRSLWLPVVRQSLAAVEPMTLQLGGVGTFGDDVVFLEVLSEQVRALHQQLVDAVRPPAEEAARHFELEEWHPHLTLRLGPRTDSDELRSAVAALGPLRPFTASEVWLCYQDATGRCSLVEPLPLGGRFGEATGRAAARVRLGLCGTSAGRARTRSNRGSRAGESSP